MPSDVTRDGFSRLTTRVDVLQREVEGEKLVTRHILEQTRRNSDDLAAIKTRLGRIEERVGNVEGKLERVEEKLEGVDLKLLARQVNDLTRNLPHIVSDAVREATKPPRRKR